MYIYIYIYATEVHYAINSRIHEKAYRPDLSTQIRNTSPLTNYFLQITFFCYLFELDSLISFFYDDDVVN